MRKTRLVMAAAEGWQGAVWSRRDNPDEKGLVCLELGLSNGNKTNISFIRRTDPVM